MCDDNRSSGTMSVMSDVAVIVTGVVGLAGIGGTFWQARLGWGREDKRIRITEKRRVYVACLAALNSGMTAAMYREGIATDKTSHTFNAAKTEAWSLVIETQLIAPVRVATLASDAFGALNNLTLETGSRFIMAMVALQEAMRVDLGEAPLHPVGLVKPLSDAAIGKDTLGTPQEPGPNEPPKGAMRDEPEVTS
jgi:hypothetical protein